VKYKGQVAVETLVSVFALFFLFIIVLGYVFLVNNSAQDIDLAFSQKNDCLKLMYSISQLNTEGDGAQLQLYLDYDFEIFSNQKAIKIGEQYCFS